MQTFTMKHFGTSSHTILAAHTQRFSWQSAAHVSPTYRTTDSHRLLIASDEAEQANRGKMVCVVVGGGMFARSDYFAQSGLCWLLSEHFPFFSAIVLSWHFQTLWTLWATCRSTIAPRLKLKAQTYFQNNDLVERTCPRRGGKQTLAPPTRK